MKFETGNNASLITYKGLTPKIHPSVFLCEGVKIIGDVQIDEDCSIWYNTVIRGDVDYIKIGKRTNIQDMCMLHVTNSRFPLNIGNNVSIAHSVSLHGCTIHDNSLIGIGAIVLDNAVVNSNVLVAAGAVVKEGFVCPERTLIAGVPGKIVRELTDADVERITNTAPHYIQYAIDYRAGLNK